MQPQLDAGLTHHVVGCALEAVRVEGGGEADRVRLGVGVEVEGAPARPFAPHGLGAAHRRIAVGLGRIDREAPFGHPVDDLHADALHGDLGAVMHVVQHQHHAARGQAAEIGVALDQGDGGAVARGGDGGAEAGGAAADDQHVAVVGDRGVARGLVDHGHVRPPRRRWCRLSGRPAISSG